MKKKLLFTLFLFVTSIGFGQNTHTLTAYDNYFDPDTLYILAGDTVNFVSLGYHSATEVDSMDWVNNVAQHNGGFYVGQGAPTNDMKFTINTIGVYYNICVPHANMGMKSIIIVGSQTTSLVEQNQLKNTATSFQVGKSACNLLGHSDGCDSTHCSSRRGGRDHCDWG